MKSLPQIQQELDELAAAGMYRSLTPMSDSGATFSAHGQEVLNFSSNDYLNLSHHPTVCKRSQEAITTWGSGATASRLLAGNLGIHEELEHSIALHKGKESALLFGSGYLANCGIITSFLPKDGSPHHRSTHPRLHTRRRSVSRRPDTTLSSQRYGPSEGAVGQTSGAQHDGRG